MEYEVEYRSVEVTEWGPQPPPPKPQPPEPSFFDGLVEVGKAALILLGIFMVLGLLGTCCQHMRMDSTEPGPKIVGHPH